MGMRLSNSAARMSGPSPPWWTSEPFSIIQRDGQPFPCGCRAATLGHPG